MTSFVPLANCCIQLIPNEHWCNRRSQFNLTLFFMVDVQFCLYQVELGNPMNVHRWRKLEGTDPTTITMLKKVKSLQKKLIMKTEEVLCSMIPKDCCRQDRTSRLVKHIKNRVYGVNIGTWSLDDHLSFFWDNILPLYEGRRNTHLNQNTETNHNI